MAKRYEKNPNPQKPLTNVTICRLKTHGKQFELACYPSKVVNFREGIESDLDEVLQIENVFTNVQKGVVSPKADLEMAFGTTEVLEVCRVVLKRGVLQQSNLERELTTNRNLNAILDMLMSKCVNPRSNRPYPESTLREAVKQTGYNVNSQEKVPKVMFLDVMKLFRERDILEIERAKMLIKIGWISGENPKASLSSLNVGGIIVSKETEKEMLILIPPALYRSIQDMAKAHEWKLSIEKMDVMEEGERKWDDEAQRTEEGGVEESIFKMGQIKIKAPEKVEQVELIEQVQEEVQEEEEEEEPDYSNMTTKDRKKAQRKSKKAARREKEKQAEMQAKIDAEKKRVAERQARLAEASNGTESTEKTEASASNEIKCNTCPESSFKTKNEHRAHFKSDWHRYNLKLKSTGTGCVCEAEFNEIANDALFFS
ncbi:hypothetical protein TL16_g05688 [Triparma laevis f. inornata]|uniref:Ribosome maturation protein SBDS n=2 Tax=Triparma laevis TaxID=1534972 RepID=A0A9W7KXK6_9STRA|nr:hypothetical protein TL16_g05688 [Triparma laevis f. inornata]GMI15527.1 hypothetical protein TrLO_g1342 [Triparma laevis f. longispina]